MNYQQINDLARKALAQRLYSQKSNSNNKKHLIKEFRFSEFDFIKFQNTTIKKSRSSDYIAKYEDIPCFKFINIS